jgi:hypothetical protein
VGRQKLRKGLGQETWAALDLPGVVGAERAIRIEEGPEGTSKLAPRWLSRDDHACARTITGGGRDERVAPPLLGCSSALF